MARRDDSRTATPPPSGDQAQERAPQEQKEQKREPTWEEVGGHFRRYLTDRSDLIKRLIRPNSKLTEMLLVRVAELVYRKEGAKLTNQRSWPSVLVALMTAAQLDLEPGHLLGDAYLVPWWDKDMQCHVWSLMPGYRGLQKLAIMSGRVKAVRAFPVYEKDAFQIRQGSSPEVLHDVFTGADRGKMIGCYAIARMVDEGADDEPDWMPAAELDKIRASQLDRSPAWKTWPDEMSRKVVLKRLCKQLPLGEAFRVAVEIDHAASDGDTAALRDIVRTADIDPSGIIDANATAKSSLPPTRAQTMADKIVSRQAERATDEREKVAAQSKAAPDGGYANRGHDTAAPPSPDHPCEACGVPIEEGRLCEICREAGE